MDKILTMPSLWAILPDRIGLTQHTYIAYLKGESHPPAPLKGGITAGLLDVDMEKMPQTFIMDGDIAVMQIDGVITPKADLFSLLFGGSTLDVMTRDFTTLVNDESVKAIVLDIDSPGGVAFGIEQFANLVFEARASKKIVSITSTMMASAAMWIGAAAEEVFITGEVVMTGSIGVVINHIDVSELYKMLGVKFTEVTAGKFKRIASSFAPLTEDGRAELQGQVDHIYKAFVADIARFRGAEAEIVSSEMADGRTFFGSQGIEVGLIDGIISPDELIKRINASVQDDESVPRVDSDDNFNRRISMFGKEAKATKEILKVKHPDIYNEVYALGETVGQKDMEAQIDTVRAESHEKGRDEGTSEGEKIGAKNELARVLAVQAQSPPGHEELIAKMVADGSSAGDAAQAVIAADKSKKSKTLADLETNAPETVKPEATEETTPAKGDDTIKAAWEGKDGAAFKAEFGNDYASYENFFKNDEKYKKTGKISLPA